MKLFVKKRVRDLFAVKVCEWKNTYSNIEQVIKLQRIAIPGKYTRLKYILNSNRTNS